MRSINIDIVPWRQDDYGSILISESVGGDCRKRRKTGLGRDRPPCAEDIDVYSLARISREANVVQRSVGVHSLKIEYYGNQFPLNGPTERRQLRRSCTVRSTASGHSYRKNRKYRKPYCLFIGKEYRLCKQRRDSLKNNEGVQLQQQLLQRFNSVSVLFVTFMAPLFQ